jgi:hypothetical protein
VPVPSGDGDAGEHATCEHGTIDLGRLRATARFDRRSFLLATAASSLTLALGARPQRTMA